MAAPRRKLAILQPSYKDTTSGTHMQPPDHAQPLQTAMRSRD